MTCQGFFGFLLRIISSRSRLSIPRHAMMKTILTIVLIGFICACFSEAQAGRGGIEAEVGDVQGNEDGPYMSTGNLPFLQHGTQSLSTKQDDMQESRLKALDEKLRKAEEEGNRPTAKGSG